MSTQTFVILKPGFQHLLKNLLENEFKQFKVIELVQNVMIPMHILDILYEEHQNKRFHVGNLSYVSSGPVTLMILEDLPSRNHFEFDFPVWFKKNQVDPIRERYGKNKRENVIHASDNQDEFEAEVKLFFPFFFEEKN